MIKAPRINHRSLRKIKDPGVAAAGLAASASAGAAFAYLDLRTSHAHWGGWQVKQFFDLRLDAYTSGRPKVHGPTTLSGCEKDVLSSQSSEFLDAE